MKTTLSLLLLLILVAGCASKTAPVGSSAQDFFRQGEEAMAKGRYREAVTAFGEARQIFESAELNRRADLNIAEAHFLDKEYVEAAAAYENFLKQYPGSAEAARVMYRLGMSYFNQILSMDRDQTATQSALVTFESLLRLYPNAPEAAEATARIQACREQLAAHELYVGRFYLKMARHQAAIGRLQKLLKDYPDYPGRSEAYLLLGQAYLNNGHPNLAVQTFEQLIADQPRSSEAARATEILRQRF
ncbi:outer membrane protein assembly factor BamD [Desulfuromonas sp. CSMB_57]|jgi:outer membrane protein assembly factor BamD|uniref:outer membrane protein assembly factor BamD n=1 Tax=Desulfuromonas sp. CSMB_57 TaxID=2807629 RepID=UPI001CD38263|nr:outer membrane protein assembly factor BamD [Desulfuromonas sp. CSMB_57]